MVLILFGLGMGVISYVVIKRKTKTLPTINDDQFLEKFKAIFPGLPDELILLERRRVAKLLGISYKKLDVGMTFSELSKQLNFLGSYDLAIGDLEQELSEYFERQQVEKPSITPSTIGELIHEMVRVKLQRSL